MYKRQLLTEANAITTIEGLIQDSSSLAFALTSGSATPTEFPSTSAFTSTTVRATFASGFFTDYRYRFIPMNGFTIDTTTTRTNVGGAAVTLEADGSVNDFRPESNIMPWAVRFRRTFTNVPSPSGVIPLFTNGPHVFQTDWQRLDYVGGGPFFENRQEFLTSVTWTKPVGVTRYRVTVIPGGSTVSSPFTTTAVEARYDVINQPTATSTHQINIGAASTTGNGGVSSFTESGGTPLFADVQGSLSDALTTTRGSTNANISVLIPYQVSGADRTHIPFYSTTGGVRGLTRGSSSTATPTNGIVVVEW